MLFALENASQNPGKNWPELLDGYSWYPSVLSQVGTAKHQARWQWITQHHPADPDTCPITTRHTFWLPGYSNIKLKDDRMIAAGGYKILNYSEFREVIRYVALEIQSKSLGPIEVGNLTRSQWNGLNEPVVSDLKKRVARKNKKNLAKRRYEAPLHYFYYFNCTRVLSLDTRV